MTEESFQQCRKVMQKANFIRGKITENRENVGKWSRINDEHSTSKTKETLDRAISKWNEWKAKLAALKFPESDIIVAKKETVQCEGCGANIASGNTYCGECLCED